jgi:hypothetical protein
LVYRSFLLPIAWIRYVFSAGLEEDAGWAEEFVAAYDRVVDAR